MINQSVTLFVLVSLMLLYRGVDLFSMREKISQLFQKCTWANEKTLSFKTRRAIIICFGNKSKVVISEVKFLYILKKEFFTILMAIVIIIFLVTCIPALLTKPDSTTSSIIVALSTACVSLFGSITNFIIEQVKTFL